MTLSFSTVRLPFWLELDGLPVDPSFDAAVVGIPWITLKASAVKLPSFLLSTACLSLASSLFAVRGVLKHTLKETIRPPISSLKNKEKG